MNKKLNEMVKSEAKLVDWLGQRSKLRPKGEVAAPTSECLFQGSLGVGWRPHKDLCAGEVLAADR
jgi:hypothetical protein